MSDLGTRLGGLAATLFAGALLAALALPGDARAQTVDLFVAPKPSDAAAASPPPSEGATREALRAVNPVALEAAAAAPAQADAPSGRSLRIELFPDAAATFAVSKVEQAYGGGSIVSAEARNGEATLVMVGGKVTGRVLLAGRTYRIQPVGGGLHRVAEIDVDELPPEAPVRRSPRGKKAEDAPQAEAEAIAPTRVDVLFAYTAKARNASDGILAEINLAVAITNEAYLESDVHIRMRLVGAQLVSYDEDLRSYDRNLDDLTSGSALAAVRTRRDAVGADLVVLLRQGGVYCGLGWINAPAAGAAAYGYSVVSRGCVEGDTVAHEIGHNMGLNHDRYVSAPASGAFYNYGFVSVPGRVQDIMAYSNQCAAAGVRCESKRLFSNPRIIVNGRPFGVPRGKTGAADGALWLNQQRGAVSRFRPVARPAAAALQAETADAAEAAPPKQADR